MKLWTLAATAAVLIISTSANAALIERLGGSAYYDDVADLTVDGVDGWRLADTLQPDASCGSQSGSVSSGYNCTGSEMGNLFYNVLGNSAGSLSNTGPFSNVQSNYYWSATEYAPTTSNIWYFEGWGVPGIVLPALLQEGLEILASIT